jgi:hypothetical protein
VFRNASRYVPLSCGTLSTCRVFEGSCQLSGTQNRQDVRYRAWRVLYSGLGSEPRMTRIRRQRLTAADTLKGKRSTARPRGIRKTILTVGPLNLNLTASEQEGQVPFGFLRPSARQTWQSQYEPYLVLSRNAASDPQASASSLHCRLIS